MSGRQLQLVAFDMIGTTVDAADLVPQAFVLAFSRHGLQLPKQAVDAVRGHGKIEAVKQLLTQLRPNERKLNEVSAQIGHSLQEILRERLVGQAVEVPGAAAVMRWLRGRGVAVALGSGLDRITATSCLRKLNWSSGVMDALVTADDVRRGRPDPQWIQVAMERCLIPEPSTVLVVGDTEADLMAGVAVGAGWTIGVTSGAQTREKLAALPHTAILESVAQLRGWIEGAKLL